MKALTLWQPWASLMAIGAKKYETRSWRAPKTLKQGDLVAIHAAKVDAMDMMMRQSRESADAAFWELDDANAFTSEGCSTLPLGAVLAVAMFDFCAPAEEIVATVSEQEKMLGDWTPGRFVWRLRVVMRLLEPIPAKGKQGLWEWELPRNLETPLMVGMKTATGGAAGVATGG